jgi:arsenite/tail-anchored protein-transporting ATPase
VNQLLFPGLSSAHCEHCLARQKMQQKYLAQILDLYDDMHVIQLPLLTKEVRGVLDLTAFSQHLISPFKP